MDSNEKRMEGERRAIRGAIRILKKHGWLPVRVWDGECAEPTKNETEMMDVIFSVDEATARFKHANHRGAHCFVVVLGNSAHECIADASMGEGWDEAMKEVWAYLETFDA